jgi:hypothetical protein
MVGHHLRRQLVDATAYQATRTAALAPDTCHIHRAEPYAPGKLVIKCQHGHALDAMHTQDWAGSHEEAELGRHAALGCPSQRAPHEGPSPELLAILYSCAHRWPLDHPDPCPYCLCEEHREGEHYDDQTGESYHVKGCYLCAKLPRRS